MLAKSDVNLFHSIKACHTLTASFSTCSIQFHEMFMSNREIELNLNFSIEFYFDDASAGQLCNGIESIIYVSLISFNGMSHIVWRGTIATRYFIIYHILLDVLALVLRQVFFFVLLQTAIIIIIIIRRTGKNANNCL